MILYDELVAKMEESRESVFKWLEFNQDMISFVHEFKESRNNMLYLLNYMHSIYEYLSFSLLILEAKNIGEEPEEQDEKDRVKKFCILVDRETSKYTQAFPSAYENSEIYPMGAMKLTLAMMCRDCLSTTVNDLKREKECV